MSAPLAERLFGITFKPEPARTVGELLVRTRASSGQSGQVVIARADDTVGDAYKLFASFDLHHLPVLEGLHVCGIVSATDLLKFYATHGSEKSASTSLSEVMTEDPEVILDTAPIDELIRRLAHAKFRCLPVVDKKQQFVEIVTTRDLVHLLELRMS